MKMGTFYGAITRRSCVRWNNFRLSLLENRLTFNQDDKIMDGYSKVTPQMKSTGVQNGSIKIDLNWNPIRTVPLEA